MLWCVKKWSLFPPPIRSTGDFSLIVTETPDQAAGGKALDWYAPITPATSPLCPPVDAFSNSSVTFQAFLTTPYFSWKSLPIDFCFRKLCFSVSAVMSLKFEDPG